MSSSKNKAPSPLVQSVLKLDSYLAELVRLGTKIESMDVQKDFDFEQIQKFMTRFAECGQGVSDEVMNMSKALNEARAEAETAAQVVSKRAEELQNRRDEKNKKMIALSQLGEKVRDLTVSLNELKSPDGEAPNDEERAKISMRLSEFEMQLNPLIDEARALDADSLAQSLVAIGQKLSVFQKAQPSH